MICSSTLVLKVLGLGEQVGILNFGPFKGSRVSQQRNKPSWHAPSIRFCEKATSLMPLQLPLYSLQN